MPCYAITVFSSALNLVSCFDTSVTTTAQSCGRRWYGGRGERNQEGERETKDRNISLLRLKYSVSYSDIVMSTFAEAVSLQGMIIFIKTFHSVIIQLYAVCYKCVVL